MPKHTKETSVTKTGAVAFEHSFKAKVTVMAPEFEYLTTLEFLDVSKLSKGKHKIDVGYLKGSCGKRLVKAVIDKGMITSFEIDPCKGSEPPAPALATLFKIAQGKLKAGNGSNKLPVPVADFMARKIEIGWADWCIWIIIENAGFSLKSNAPAAKGTVYFCCISISSGLNCGALPFLPD
jgi:hypothetical protein